MIKSIGRGLARSLVKADRQACDSSNRVPLSARSGLRPWSLELIADRDRDRGISHAAVKRTFVLVRDSMTGSMLRSFRCGYRR